MQEVTNTASIVSKNHSHNYLIVMPRYTSDVNTGYIFPLGIAYVSASLKHAGHNIFTLNTNHYEESIYSLMKKCIEKHSINVVMTGGLSPHYNMIDIIAKTAKKIDDNIIVVIGGGIITSNPKISMKALVYADIGVIGEGEVTSIELCDALKSRENLLDVDGLIIKYKNSLFCSSSNSIREKSLYLTERRQEIIDIDKIPWPDYEGFEFEKTLDKQIGQVGFNDTRLISMISSRSCPFNCTFCFHTVGKKYRQRSIYDFFEEFEYLYNKYRFQGLILLDELFGQKLDRFYEFMSRINSYDIRCGISMRVSDIKQQMIPLLKSTKCIVALGLESADNIILNSMKKNITIEQIDFALKLLHLAGIPFNGNFIFGDIVETFETAQNTLNWRFNHPDYNIFLRLITPYPGSYIYKYSVDNNIIRDEVNYLKSGCPQVNISKMSDLEFKKILDIINDVASNHAKRLQRFTAHFAVTSYRQKIRSVDISGTCNVCGTENIWERTPIFMPTFVICDSCGSQYYPPLPENIYNIFDKKINKLLSSYNSIALWGMAYHAIDVVTNSKAISNPNIFLIDICTTKQGLKLNNKSIYSPEIIFEKKIQVVVVMAPTHIGMIGAQIENQFADVKNIINVLNLI